MNGYAEDRRTTPYSNSRMFSPALIWAILVTLIGNLVAGVVFAIRLEGGGIEQNTANINVVDAKIDAEILHVRELQEKQDDHVKEALEDIKKDQDEIKELIREALRRDSDN